MRRICCYLLLPFVLFSLSHATDIISPDDYLGFPLGADRQLADYHQIVNYFELLDSASPKVVIEKLGKTTDGNEMILVIISSEENIRQLDKYKAISRSLARPGALTPQEAEALIQQGKVLASITSNIHSTEIGSSQMALEFAHRLATQTDPQTQFYLDNVILLLMPSANPDGQIMVCDWYRQWVGTIYEGGNMPWLYHRYVGHDTNRDFFMLTQKETKMINRVISQEWLPQVHLDEHQMGSSGPRMFVPPYVDPMSPNLHPMLVRMESLFGSNMSMRLEEKGMAGVIDSWAFDSYWPGGSYTAAWKNIISLLTELASCQIASPIFINDTELRAGWKGLTEYKQQINFPNPWNGGWWRLRDIIDYELVASYSFLETSAKYRTDILRTTYNLNRECIEKGKTEPPFAFIIPTEQHDVITMAKLIEILLEHGIEIYQLQHDEFIANRKYKNGSIVVPLAQPLRPFIKELLDVQTYPEIKLDPKSEILYPYDVTAWSLPLQMGVQCDRIDSGFQGDLTPVLQAPYPDYPFPETSAYGYAISHQYNHTTIAINRLLKNGIECYLSPTDFVDNDKQFRAGTVLIPHKNGIEQKLKSIVGPLHLPVHSCKHFPKETRKLKAVTVGLYKPWRASMDEGWTRWLLEQYEFEYESVYNDQVKKGNLDKKFDVLIIPDIDKKTIISPKPKDNKEAKFYRPLPDPYEGGIEQEGIKNLREFVEYGGTLITLDGSSMLPIDEFPLPIENILEDKKREDFHAPGVLLQVMIDTAHPIGWGMPEKAAAFFSRSPAFRTSIPFGNLNRTIVAQYPEELLLLSGWMIGEKQLHRKAAIVEQTFGKGNIILLGFKVQHRAQPHGTFKLLFNAIHAAGLSKTN